MSIKVCKDCVAEGLPSSRAALYAGPRCYTHHRVQEGKRAIQEHERRIKAFFGISEEQYQEIYRAQGGHCFICERATGKTKKLAVDHDHKKGCEHDPKKGCPECIRALLCFNCNQLLGRYDVKALHRAIAVLTDPPAQKVLKRERPNS